MYLIWSHEHGAWWKPNSSGYTTDIRKAGVYAGVNVAEIINGATLDWTLAPNEVPVRLSDLPDEAKLLIDSEVTF